MSAFFFSVNRDGAPFCSVVAAAMMDALDHFGHDAAHLVVQQNFALGYQSLWTVPEERGERQPLYDKKSDSWFVFYGRVDNRAVLFSALGETGSGSEFESEFESVSDAALMHRFILKFDKQRLKEVIGPFVFVLYEPASGRILAARDGMGGRNLVYRVTAQHIHIASYELAIVAHPTVEYQFNEARVARMLAGLMEDTLSSTIAGITPLSPGDLIQIKQRDVCLATFYRADAARRIHLPDDQAYAAQFKRLLKQAVRRRARSIGPVASMLSGGMDSVPVSILLSAELKQRGEKLTALSWVFNRFPDADERCYSSPVCDMHGIEQVCIDCDDVWPGLDDTTHVDPVMPFGIPYSEYQQVALREAQNRGIRTVVTGIHGDLLYGHTQSILKELLMAGRFTALVSEFKTLWCYFYSKRYFLKQLVIAQLPGVHAFIDWRRRQRKLCVEFLQEHINAQLQHQQHPLFKQSLAALRPNNYRNVFDGFAGEDMALGRHMEAGFAVERRYPFRDRDLAEFMQAIPSDQLYFNLVPRPIVRNAFKDEFTPELLARTDKTDFSFAVSNGIQKDQHWQRWFAAAKRKWSYYVKECYFSAENQQEKAKEIVQWRCAYYNYWLSICYNRIAEQLGTDNGDK